MYNNLGIPGHNGFGVGICDPSKIPHLDLELLSNDIDDINYGNYKYKYSNSIMVYIPKFYYRIGHFDNSTYNTYHANSIDIKQFSTTTEAENSGYKLHRAFINNGIEIDGFFVDKYLCSNGYGVASSLKNGSPISTHADNNPISQINTCSVDQFYEAINASKSRGSIFFCNTRFNRSALFMLFVAHQQSFFPTNEYRAWRNYNTLYNYIRGCNNKNLGDIIDNTITYSGTGYEHALYGKACKTGSSNYFNKTTHNGQSSGVCDLNGCMSEIEIGITRISNHRGDSTSGTNGNIFYILKEDIDIKELNGEWNIENACWGDVNHLNEYYDAISIPYIIHDKTSKKYGNRNHQIFSNHIKGFGNEYLFTNLGLPKNNNSISSFGSSLFGNCSIYNRYRNNLCVVSGGSWSDGENSSILTIDFNFTRTCSDVRVGFRLACHPLA